ncbi:MAG: hypothetical protein AAGA53_13175 [Pseudomonadota bacterium]
MNSDFLSAYSMDALSWVPCCGHAVYDGLALTGFALTIVGAGYYFYLAVSRYRVRENKQNPEPRRKRENQ